MTEEDKKARIGKLEERLGHLYTYYREVKETLRDVDREIMTAHKEKWSLERSLVPVKKCAPAKERRVNIEKELENAPLDRLMKNFETMDEASKKRVLEMLQTDMGISNGDDEQVLEEEKE